MSGPVELVGTDEQAQGAARAVGQRSRDAADPACTQRGTRREAPRSPSAVHARRRRRRTGPPGVRERGAGHTAIGSVRRRGPPAVQSTRGGAQRCGALVRPPGRNDDRGVQHGVRLVWTVPSMTMRGRLGRCRTQGSLPRTRWRIAVRLPQRHGRRGPRPGLNRQDVPGAHRRAMRRSERAPRAAPTSTSRPGARRPWAECWARPIAWIFRLRSTTWTRQGVEDALGFDPPQDLADLMHRAWVDFVTDGDPGWPAFTPDTRPAMVFDGESRVIDDPLRLPRSLWGAA